MEIVHERCAGLDVHKKTVVACVVTPEHKEVRTFGTMTRELMGMADWFSSLAVTHVAMESTGVYWRGGLHLPAGGDLAPPGGKTRDMRAGARPRSPEREAAGGAERPAK